MVYAPESSVWQELVDQVPRLSAQGIPALFQHESNRGELYRRQAAGLTLDFSRQLIDDSVLEGLLQLAMVAEVPTGIRAMFAGEAINTTERRPALHVALRRPSDKQLWVDGQEIMDSVTAERRRMADFVMRVHSGEVVGFTGRPITDVINIGIGGSDLGIVMAVEALAEQRNAGINVHCVSNIDGVQLAHQLRRCDPATTLFVVCSKSFTTSETRTNAQVARDWLVEAGGKQAIALQVAAVSTNHDAMNAFGVALDRRFTMWDWVGGRYSVWSSVGLSVALAIGWDNFRAFLEGAHEMDQHFESAKPADNLPILLALIGIWNRNFLKLPTLAVLPYDQHLSRFPAFLQQLEMESNGKQVRRGGQPVESETCPVIFGEPGSNAQHSFYQLLHQGPAVAAVDFLLPAQSGMGLQAQHDLAIINCLAQAQALAEGRAPAAIRSEEPGLDGELVPHKVHDGSRPSNLIVFPKLQPRTLGALVALYEHKVFVQSLVWDINAFDQWGVELGKILVAKMAAEELSVPLPVRASLAHIRRLSGEGS